MRSFLIFILSALCFSVCARSEDKGLIHMANYAEIADYAHLRRLGINTLLVNLKADGSDWTLVYEAAGRHRLRLIPLIWGEEQAAWKWNRKRAEWELNPERYPNSVGARFLAFLKVHPEFLKRTFALYSFHEPLAQPKKTGPIRLRKFYEQITREEFPGGTLSVYGEDITMGWPQSDECLSGVLDYEAHNVYPFAATGGGKYRPFDVHGNHYGPPIDDMKTLLAAELATLDERLQRYARVEPGVSQSRPKPIILIQTFVCADHAELWNRMPSAREMQTVAEHLTRKRGDRIAGLAWYPFRNPATEYRQWLAKDRIDPTGGDRWQVIRVLADQMKVR